MNILEELKLSKKQNNNERYDYLCQQFNAVDYAIKLEKYTIKLQQENRKQKEIIDKAIEQLEKGITFCENDSQGIYDKCNIAINREKEVFDILKEVSE